MSSIENPLNTVNTATQKHTVTGAQDVATGAGDTPQLASVIKPEDAPSRHATAADSTQTDLLNRAPYADVDEFLASFSKQGPLYQLVEELNSKMKAIFKEARETEAEIRINKYTAQVALAQDKHEHMIAMAEEVKQLRDEAANQTIAMGTLKLSLNVFGMDPVFGSSITALYEGRNQLLRNEADFLSTENQALNTLIDSAMNLLDKEGQLANAQIEILEGLHRTYSSLLDGLHQNYSSAFNSMSRTIV